MDNTEIVERLVKVEQSEKSAHHRLDEHETKINQLSDVYIALTKVDDKVTSVEKDVSEMKSDIKDIKEKPGKRWDTIVLALITRSCNSNSRLFIRKIRTLKERMTHMKIELVQGDDSPIYKFQRKNANNEVITTLPQKMWITVKESYKSDKSIFQKTLDNGIMYSIEDNYYRFQFSPDDTCNLPCGGYGFDIAIINESGKKKTLKNNCILNIVEHYTHKYNEV